MELKRPRERGIIFSADMIDAIVRGEKTQTRRVVKVPKWIRAKKPDIEGAYPDKGLGAGGYLRIPCHDDDTQQRIRCPYGSIGDRLWVRESWRVIGWREGEPLYLETRDGSQYEENYEACADHSAYEEWYTRMVVECAEDCDAAGIPLNSADLYAIPDGQLPPTRWRSPRYMPRQASRLTLELTDVRVERLQDIHYSDAIKEGFERKRYGTADVYRNLGPYKLRSEVHQFRKTWEHLNAKRGHPWASNPWVWVLTFKLID